MAMLIDNVPLVEFIERTTTRLNLEFLVAPDIRIIFSNTANDFEGECNVLYHRKDMYIAVILSWQLKYNPATMNLLTCLLTHEYAHYIYSLKLTADERVADTRRYLTDDTSRRHDEYRTWSATKKMLKYMGLWDDTMMTACNQFRYASLKY